MAFRIFPLLVLLALFAAGSSQGHAHGDDQVMIEALTEQLLKAPEAELYLRRGELHRHLQAWEKADTDFVSAGRLDPALVLVDYFRARALLEAGAPARALPLVERYLEKAPDEPEGHFLHGDILAALGRHDEGASQYAEGIRRAPSPRPEHFLRRARFLAAAPAAEPDRIVAAIDEGLKRLGPVIALVDFAIAVELERRNPDGAIARIDQLLTHVPRRERWLARRGEILANCGRRDEAVTSYRASLVAIADLPERFRDTVPIEKLTIDVRAALVRLEAR